MHDADDTGGDERAWQDVHLAQHEDIQRVAILAQRLRNEAVVDGIGHGGIKHAVQAQQARGFVHLVLGAAATADFHHTMNPLRNGRTRRNVMPGMHGQRKKEKGERKSRKNEWVQRHAGPGKVLEGGG